MARCAIAAVLVVGVLTGCSWRSENVAADALGELKAAGSWEADAVWEFESVERPVVMRGHGEWRERGTLVRWEQSWAGSTVTMETVADEVVLEDGTRYAIASELGRLRITRDLFFQLEPLKLLAESGMELRPGSGPGIWIGSGECLGTRCDVKLTLETRDGVPTRAELLIEQPENWIRVVHEYTTTK